MSLVIASSVDYGKDLALKILKSKKLALLSGSVYILLFATIAYLQIKIFYPEIYPEAKYIPQDVDVSRNANFGGKLYLDDDFTPIAVYYSGRNLTNLITLPEGKRSALELFKSDEDDFSMITRNYVLDILTENGVEYEVKYSNESHSIISKPKSQR